MQTETQNRCRILNAKKSVECCCQQQGGVEASLTCLALRTLQPAKLHGWGLQKQYILIYRARRYMECKGNLWTQRASTWYDLYTRPYMSGYVYMEERESLAGVWGASVCESGEDFHSPPTEDYILQSHAMISHWILSCSVFHRSHHGGSKPKKEQSRISLSEDRRWCILKLC